MVFGSARILPETHNHLQIQLIKEAFDVIQLDDNQKRIITNRFTSLIAEYADRCRKYSISFHTLRLTITIGSLIVPAILSMELTGSRADHWVVWLLSLLVTISNALLNLLKVDKKYYTLNTVFHHIICEGWLYVELSGKYSGFKTPGEIPTHENQFVYFCHSLEKIRMKQVEEEYLQLTEITNADSNSTLEQFIHPTPFKHVPTSTTANINSKGLVNGSFRRNTTILFTGKNTTDDSTSLDIGIAPNATESVK